jgi:hypothetical protein
MSRPPSESGGTPKGTAANMNRAKTKKPDTLHDLSNWLRSCWLRHYVLFSALGSETDREQMARIGTFIDALKGVRK